MTKSKLTRAILLGFGANAFGQLVTLGGQLLQMPVMISNYGVLLTGEWLLISTFPTYIALTEGGLSNVAANEMSIAMSEGRSEAALRILHSVCRFIVVAGAILLALISALGFYINLPATLNLTEMSPHEASLVLVMLSFAALLSLGSGIFYGQYRACNKGPRIFILMNLMRLIELIALIAAGLLTLPLPVVAASQLVVRAVSFMFILRDSRKYCGVLPLGFIRGSWSEVLKMVKPAVAFMAFPVGNAIYFQGLTLVVNYQLGAAAVVGFNACRTLSRGAPMILNIIRQTLWMEYPHLYGKRDLQKLRNLQRASVEVALLVVAATVILIAPFGPKLIHWWTLGKVELTFTVLLLFLLVAGLNGFWNVASTLLIALNKHEAFARLYLLCVSGALVASYFASPRWGMPAIGFSLLIAELPLCYVALRASCQLSQDRLSALLISLLKLSSVRHFWHRKSFTFA